MSRSRPTLGLAPNMSIHRSITEFGIPVPTNARARYPRVASWRMMDRRKSCERFRGRMMNSVQAFLLGVAVAWTPSLVVLALLVRSSVEEGDERLTDHPVE